MPVPGPTLVLLDTNAYLRLAKRVRPMLGVEFGQKIFQVFHPARMRQRFQPLNNVHHSTGTQIEAHAFQGVGVKGQF